MSHTIWNSSCLLYMIGWSHISWFLCFSVPTVQLRCSETSSAASQVCGEDGRTYASICHLIQQSNTEVQFEGPCNRTGCENSPVSCYTRQLWIKDKIAIKRPNLWSQKVLLLKDKNLYVTTKKTKCFLYQSVLIVENFHCIIFFD